MFGHAILTVSGRSNIAIRAATGTTWGEKKDSVEDEILRRTVSNTHPHVHSLPGGRWREAENWTDYLAEIRPSKGKIPRMTCVHGETIKGFRSNGLDWSGCVSRLKASYGNEGRI